MKLILVLVFAIKCNGFLLDSNTEAPSSGLDDKRYNSLMDLLMEERRSRKNLEAAVSRELLTLKQDVSRCQCNNGHFENPSNNETKKLQTDLSTLRNDYKTLQIKFNQLEQNNTALNFRIQKLEHDVAVIQPPSNVTNTKQLAEAIQISNNKLTTITNEVNARKQDFIALYHKVVATEDRLENVSKTLSVESNKTLTTLHQDIVNSSIVTEQRLYSEITNLQAKQNETIFNLKEQAVKLQQSLDKDNNRVAVTSCVGNGKVYSSGEIIPFNSVKTVKGIANINLMKTNGIFRCERAGIYLVTAFVQIKHPSGGFEIYHGSIKIADAYMYLADVVNKYQTGTASVIVDINVNENISVKAWGSILVYYDIESCLTIVQL